MTSNTSTRILATIVLGAVTGVIALSQEAPPAPARPSQDQGPRAWRRVTDPAPPPPPGDPAAPETARNAEPQEGPADAPAPPPPAAYPRDPDPNYRPLDAYGQNRGGYQNPPMQRRPENQEYRYGPSAPIPPELSVRPGTYLTVRIDQPLSSEHNHAGDAFTATLVKPLVIDGVVIAERGQTLSGRVVESQKAGRVEGVSRLGVELIDMALADGQQVPLKTQFVSRTGPTAFGRDATAIGAATLGGAAIGAGVNGGVGAGVGAAAGLVVGTLGVLLTRGHATVIYPESVLTFRIENPITISTVRAPQAFHYVDPGEYQRADSAQERYQMRSTPPPQGGGYYGGGPYYGGAPYNYGSVYYGPSYYPYYNPYFGGLSFYYGPRFYGGRGYYRGGGFYYRGRR